MSEQICPRVIEFDQNTEYETSYDQARSIECDVLILTDIVMRFAQVERVPRYTPETRENNTEHSYMLGLVGQEIAAQYFPRLDPGIVAQLASVHDLLELKTGDVATFALSDKQLQDKASAEHAMLESVCAELTPYNAFLLETYERQLLPEARFVRFIDKLLPVAVDILGPGSQVMHEDYATFTKRHLDEAETALKNRFECMFPEPELNIIHQARNVLATMFASVFQPAEYIQDTLF